MVIFLVLSVVLTGMLVFFGIKLHQALDRFTIKKMYTAAIEAPSVTVCIPARNETHAMTQCLERVLASDYEKLEIVVYDDRSKDDTSILIKSFAHAGVRFVPGGSLPKGWLGRNHALETLAREASGTYLLFMGVDTFIQPTTISWLVSYVLTEKLKMASVLPGRTASWRSSVLFGHLRYFWELIFSRPSAPAVSSSLWMIERHELLDTLGSFASHKDMVQPEAAFAARLGIQHYHCLLGNERVGVTYENRWQSQVETSRRLLFPLVGGTTLKGIAALIGLVLLNLPLFTVLGGFFMGWTMMQVMALWLLFAYMALYSIYTRVSWSRWWWLGGLLWPVVIFQELILFIQSMWGWRRGTITWKGRLVAASPFRVDSFTIDE